jgi:hypothetical protein
MCDMQIGVIRMSCFIDFHIGTSNCQLNTLARSPNAMIFLKVYEHKEKRGELTVVYSTN